MIYRTEPDSWSAFLAVAAVGILLAGVSSATAGPVTVAVRMDVTDDWRLVVFERISPVFDETDPASGDAEATVKAIRAEYSFEVQSRHDERDIVIWSPVQLIEFIGEPQRPVLPPFRVELVDRRFIVLVAALPKPGPAWGRPYYVCIVDTREVDPFPLPRSQLLFAPGGSSEAAVGDIEVDGSVIEGTLQVHLRYRFHFNFERPPEDEEARFRLLRTEDGLRWMQTDGLALSGEEREMVRYRWDAQEQRRSESSERVRWRPLTGWPPVAID